MPFPTTGILDAFADTEGPPMTGWITPTLASGLQSASGVCLSSGANGAGIFNTSYGADCETYVTITTAAGVGVSIAVLARFKDQTSFLTADGYYVQVTEAATDTWAIIRGDNGVGTTLGATFTQEVANGDSIGIQIIGSTIGAWYKASAGAWTELATRTDSTYAAGGYSGLIIGDTTGRADNFGGGTYIPPAGNPHYAYAQQ